jgi:lincosamide nucleotidyltransferase A/C/D/E
MMTTVKDRPVSARRAIGRVRLLGLAGTRRAYQVLSRGPLRRLIDSGPMQSLRLRFHLPMTERDVVELVGLLAGADAPCWIAGGWGIDALAGHRTRRHKDLDLVLDRADLPAALDVLAQHGFAPLPLDLPGAERHTAGAVLLPDREIVRDGAGRTLDLHPVDVLTWPGSVAEPFTTGTIAGHQIPCVSARVQAVAHRGYPILDEHRADVELIESLIARER